MFLGTAVASLDTLASYFFCMTASVTLVPAMRAYGDFDWQWCGRAATLDGNIMSANPM